MKNRIKMENKKVYTCTDGKEFTDKQGALDHQFLIDVDMGSYSEGLGMISSTRLRDWLKDNKNFVLDYLGTTYDPVEVGEEGK